MQSFYGMRLQSKKYGEVSLARAEGPFVRYVKYCRRFSCNVYGKGKFRKNR